MGGPSQEFVPQSVISGNRYSGRGERRYQPNRRRQCERGGLHSKHRLIGSILFSNGSMEMARPKGFEPLTPRFVVWCSIQLSYGRPADRVAVKACSGREGVSRGSFRAWQVGKRGDRLPRCDRLGAAHSEEGATRSGRGSGIASEGSRADRASGSRLLARACAWYPARPMDRAQAPRLLPGGRGRVCAKRMRVE